MMHKKLSVYVIRIDYSNNEIMNDVKKGIVRQGWSKGNLNLCNQSFEEFGLEWKALGWGDLVRREYNMLMILNEVSVGDIVIVPKVEPQVFLIGIVKSTIQLDNGFNDDYKTYIELGDFKSITYYESLESENISATFSGPYRRRNNRVFKESVIESSKIIMSTEYSSQSSKTIQKIASGITIEYSDLKQKVTKIINEWSPRSLEKIIEEVFVSNGFHLIERNSYDGKGADIDLLMEIPINPLFNSLLVIDKLQKEKFSLMLGKSDYDQLPRVRVQAKNKKGVDANPMEGLNQLSHDFNNEENDINILINLSNQIEDYVFVEATKRNIILIDGNMFAGILLNHFISLDLFEI